MAMLIDEQVERMARDLHAHFCGTRCREAIAHESLLAERIQTACEDLFPPDADDEQQP